MPYFRHKCILGDLYFDKNMQPCSKPRQQKAQILEPSAHKKKELLQSLKRKDNWTRFVSENIKQTTLDLSKAIHADTFVIQTAEAVDDLQKAVNILHIRIREWIGFIAPELLRKFSDTGAVVKLLTKVSLPDLIKREGIDNTIGVHQPAHGGAALKQLIISASKLQELLEREQEVLDRFAEEVIPNITYLCGATLGAKLLAKAGTLERMAKLPASTIQLLGAETALFRHLKTKARPPKHGILHEHPLLNKVDKKDKGKAARDLANKIAVAAKVDYFKGDFVGKDLKKQLEKRFAKW